MQIAGMLSTFQNQYITENEEFSSFCSTELQPYTAVQKLNYSNNDANAVHSNNAELFSLYHVNENPLGKLPDHDVIWEDFANFDDAENEFSVDFEESDGNLMSNEHPGASSPSSLTESVSIDDIFKDIISE